MFTRSHLQEMKRRYASMYAPLIEEKFEEHCGVCGEQGIEEVEIDERLKDGQMVTLTKDLKTAKKGFAKGEKVKVKIISGMTHIEHPEKPSVLIQVRDLKKYVKEEVELDESLGLQLKMAFDDAKIKMKSKKGKIVIAKKDKKKATDVLTKTLPSKLKKYVDKAIDNFIVFEEVEIDEAVDPAYPPTIKNLRMIVKDKQHQKFMFPKGKALVDLFTASAIIAVYDGMKKPELKNKLEDMIKTKEGFLKTQAFAMKMVK